MISAVNVFELEHTNSGLHRGEMGNRDRTSSISAKYRTSMNRTYVDALERVLSAITKIQVMQYTTNDC